MPSRASALQTRRSHEMRELQAAADGVAVEGGEHGNGYASSAAIAALNGWATIASAARAKSAFGRAPMS